jgi:type IV pilus assembly protein PilB
MIFNDELRDLVMKRSSTNLLRAAARRNGMRLLRDNGLKLVYEGITTIEEVARETMAAEE